MNQRKQKAKQMMEKPNFASQIDHGKFEVRSQTNPEKYYLVSTTGNGLVCECKDHTTRKADCKHIKIILEKIKKKSCHSNQPFRIMERSKLKLCKYCDSGRLIKRGVRKNKNGNIQRYQLITDRLISNELANVKYQDKRFCEIMVKTVNPKDRCPRCGQGSLVTDANTGENFCGKCGFVITDKVEESGPEWRSFSNEGENKSRAGVPTSLAMHDMGLATVINPQNRDATGKPLTASMKSTIERLRTWDSRSQVHEPVDRNFRQAFSELDRLKDKLAVGDAVIEKAAYIYRKALEKGLVRGRSISALIASALYAACRDTETPRTLKDIGQASNIKRKDIARCYRLLLRELNLKMPVVDPVKCISRIASKAGLSEKTKRKATKILQKAEELKISAGKDPMGLAAAALYVACVTNGENKTQRDVAEAAGVTEVTIRNRYKGLKVALNL